MMPPASFKSSAMREQQQWQSARQPMGKMRSGRWWAPSTPTQRGNGDDGLLQLPRARGSPTTSTPLRPPRALAWRPGWKMKTTGRATGKLF
ncbi:Os03g0569100 [Oryza sativa Japonica Group]|uniref:Os03g0569100 protein n=1 Tax=Oryza sativa subsp. japonica TaxID=39947 RepID=A0A0P0W032_ORYSJ|nr:Os03g0569100 [Oryza sativa Japonica Group]